MRIEVNQLPPVSSSPNWRGHWAERYKAGRIYQNAVFYSCVDARNRAYLEGKSFPFLGTKLKLTFIFPEQRQRDQDNTLARFKPGLDAIVASGLILNDDTEHLVIEPPAILVDKERAPLTIIELEEIVDDDKDSLPKMKKGGER